MKKKQLIVIVSENMYTKKENTFQTQKVDSFLSYIQMHGNYFCRAYSCQPCFDTNMAAILTGMYPHKTGVYREGMPSRSGYKKITHRLFQKGIATELFIFDEHTVNISSKIQQFLLRNKRNSFLLVLGVRAEKNGNTFKSIDTMIENINQIVSIKEKNLGIIVTSVLGEKQEKLGCDTVPLLTYHIPTLVNQTYHQVVSQISLCPTIMTFFGQPEYDTFQGESLQLQIQKQENVNIFLENHMDFAGEGMQLSRCIVTPNYVLSIEYSGKDYMYAVENEKVIYRNLLYEPAYEPVRNQLHDELLQYMNDTMDPFRGYYWDVRKWRYGMIAKWDMQREAPIPKDEIDYEDLDYFTGLTYDAEHPEIEFSLKNYYAMLGGEK